MKYFWNVTRMFTKKLKLPSKLRAPPAREHSPPLYVPWAQCDQQKQTCWPYQCKVPGHMLVWGPQRQWTRQAFWWNLPGLLPCQHQPRHSGSGGFERILTHLRSAYSEPSKKAKILGTVLLHTSTATPLLDPPALRLVSCGLRTGPVLDVQLEALRHISSQTPFPTIFPPVLKIGACFISVKSEVCQRPECYQPWSVLRSGLRLACIQDSGHHSGIILWNIAFQKFWATHHGYTSHSYIVFQHNFLVLQLPACGSLDVGLVIPDGRIYLDTSKSS